MKVFYVMILLLLGYPSLGWAKCGFEIPCRLLVVEPVRCEDGNLNARIVSQVGIQCDHLITTVGYDIKDSMGEIRRLVFLPSQQSCDELMKSTKLTVRMSQDWCEWGARRPNDTRFADVIAMPGKDITNDGSGQKTAK